MSGFEDATSLRECCQTRPGAEHYVRCPKFQQPLTVEEIAALRNGVLRGVVSD